MRALASGIAGLILRLGLLISGMANPAKVQNFLDLVGTFDPSLIFVMLTAVVVTFLGYRLVLRRERPVLAERFSLPTAKEIDAKVIAGRPIGFLSGAGHHLARAAGKRDARLRVRHADRHSGARCSSCGGKTRHGRSKRVLAMVIAPPLIWTQIQFDEAEEVIGRALDLTLNDVAGEFAA
jgi:uncharacterized protein DUF6691